MKKVMLKICLKYLLLTAFISLSLPGKANVPDSLINVYIDKTIRYLSLNQIKQTIGINCFEGEWPTYIENNRYIPFLGPKGKSAYDSNGFNTLFINNILCELYLKNISKDQIKPILERTSKNIQLYRNGSTFNFWQLLDIPSHLKCRHKQKQRRANHFHYKTKFINHYANIFDDADDTAAGYLGMFYLNEIAKKDSGITSFNFSKDSLSKMVSTYRDLGERRTNWYNKRTGFNYRTGAYLTWFGPDRKPNNIFKWFSPYHSKQNILYGSNEIDCVVNANILRTLSILDIKADGMDESKQFIHDAFKNKSCFTCAVYYPTEFSFHYSLAKSINSGVTGLDTLRSDLINHILNLQNQEGYWNSVVPGNDIQSTLYALNTLMILGDQADSKTSQAVNHALDYLLNNIINEGEISYWKGGVFFSGGSAIRYTHVWRSDAYTSALALEALVNYREFSKEK